MITLSPSFLAEGSKANEGSEKQERPLPKSPPSLERALLLCPLMLLLAAAQNFASWLAGKHIQDPQACHCPV